jgi:uncharacterized protein YggE
VEGQDKKQIFINNSSGGVLVFFILLFLFAKWGPSLPLSVSSQQKGEPFVVSGEGKVFVTPDMARLSFGIEESGSSLKEVQDSVNRKSKTLTDSLKKLGIEEKDIKTSSYSVYPQYDFEATPQRIQGFQVSINYDVKIRDLDKVNDAITVTTASGANMVGGVSFEVNDETRKDKLLEARKIAVSEAKEKAEGLAQAAGINLGKVVNISENSMGEPSPISYARDLAVNSAELEKPSEPEIVVGETELRVYVSLSYEIR